MLNRKRKITSRLNHLNIVLAISLLKINIIYTLFYKVKVVINIESTLFIADYSLPDHIYK